MRSPRVGRAIGVLLVAVLAAALLLPTNSKALKCPPNGYPQHYRLEWVERPEAPWDTGGYPQLEMDEDGSGKLVGVSPNGPLRIRYVGCE